MQQSPSWEAYGHSSTEETPILSHSLAPFTVFTRTHNRNLCCAQWILSTSSRYCTDNIDCHCYKYLSTVTRLLAEHLRNQSLISGRSIRTTMGPRSPLFNWYWGITAQAAKRQAALRWTFTSIYHDSPPYAFLASVRKTSLLLLLFYEITNRCNYMPSILFHC